MGIGDAGILSVGQSVEATAKEMLAKMTDEDSEMISLYYGEDIRHLIMSLRVEEEPGKRYSYKSGDTQLLSFVLEAALAKEAGKGKL